MRSLQYFPFTSRRRLLPCLNDDLVERGSVAISACIVVWRETRVQDMDYAVPMWVIDLLTFAAFLHAALSRWRTCCRGGGMPLSSVPSAQATPDGVRCRPSLAVLSAPWLLMGVVHGTLVRNLTSPIVYSAMFLVFGPVVAIQASSTLGFLRREDAT